ncbi:DNA-binding WRKY transcription factor [Mucor lusitanicus]|uniref:DNA-binding WRKY transcription factor n=1 Tax=Mucor lusitanicus CBS 277.49 TaxID=747725 RepID=A0A168MV07_MUCCL|nr:DNA-binding WRKY transcription factor [Mucor lusitanicus CBS 277.49]
MNIQTLTSAKSYSNSSSNNSSSRSYLNACPSDDAGLLRYSSSPPATSTSSPAALPRYSYHRESTSPSPSSTATDLQSVVSKYHANPELLKLILASKVEEDKRRTEEAKLKAKELDLYFKNQQDHYKSNRNHQQEAFILQQRRRRSSSSSNSSTSSSSNNNAGESIHRRIAPYAIPRPIVMSPPSRRNSSASALLSMNQLSINNSSNTPSLSTSAPANTNLFPPPPPPPPPTASMSYNSARPQEPVQKISRRRRSMQAITKIVETTEFPYDDRHFWKNNGNTVQKKTGCKSVYYKCANSCKGCPVNKTVVEQPDGSYIIKYRGDHISECSQVEHIRDL